MTDLRARRSVTARAVADLTTPARVAVPWRARQFTAFGVALLLVACSNAGTGGRASAAAPAGGTPAASAPAAEFQNPVIIESFPDPFVLKAADTYYAYSTRVAGTNIQVARSSDLVTWEALPDALPKLPPWTSGGKTWAPEVVQTSAGYVMYYTTDAGNARTPNGDAAQCISVAVSSGPAGPFEDTSERPFVCQNALGGSIDATSFADADGKRYLLWKNDGNCCRIRTQIFIQELSADGLRLNGRPRATGAVNDASWEGSVVEAPSLILRSGIYYLLYTGNDFESKFYGVGYATSRTVTGPYRDAAENPILRTKDDVAVGPGHQTVVEVGADELWLGYHAYLPSLVGPGQPRPLFFDELVVEDGKLVVRGPDAGPQRAPTTSP